MRITTLLRALFLLTLSFLAVESARGATDSRYPYEQIWRYYAGELEGWTTTKEPDDLGLSTITWYTTEIAPADKDRVLAVWNFNTVSNSDKFSPYAKSKVMGRKAGEDAWRLLTSTTSGLTVIPANFNAIRISSYPVFVTMGDFPVSKDVICEVDTKIIKGVQTENGIRATGDFKQEIELEITPKTAGDVRSLTNAFFRLLFRYMSAPYSNPDNVKFGKDGYSVKMTAIAVAGGENVSLEYEMDFGSHSSPDPFDSRAFILPENSEKIRIIWNFDVQSDWANPDDWDDTTQVPVSYAYIDYLPDSDKFTYGIEHRGVMEYNGYFSNSLPDSQSLWYDIDGDGLKEFTNEGKLYRCTPGFRDTEVLSRSLVRYPTGWIGYKPDNLGIYDNRTLYRLDGVNIEEIFTADSNISIIDFNNDGLPDFGINSGQGFSKVLTLDATGKYVENHVRLYTPQEYYDLEVKDPYVNPLGMNSDMFGRDTSYASSFASYANVDINNDGYPDFLDARSGRYLLNTGDGGYVTDKFGGKVILRDLDNDGLADLLVYNNNDKSLTAIFQRNGGESESKQLFKGLKCGDNIWCRDFDKDGDIDILVPFNGEDNGQSYLLMLENQGNLTFKKHETYIEGGRNFHACTDIDSDGNYEILSTDGAVIDCYKIDGIKVSDTPAVLVPENGSVPAFAADLDGSGVLRIVSYRSIFTPCPDKTNMRPDTPEAPAIVYDAEHDRLTVSWNAGNDKETAPLDLTYELRIGTAPGKGDIVYADALEDGRRKNILPGNCGYSLMRRFDTSTWPQGKVYVSLQVVDDNGLGSEFSSAASFETRVPTSFVINAESDISAVDEAILLIPNNYPPEGISYEWDLDDGEILSQSDLETTVSFPTPGKKNITLRAVSSEGTVSSTTKQQEIVPARFVTDNKIANMDMAFDMDLDGILETVSIGNSSTVFYEGDSEGNYTPVKKLYNANIPKVRIGMAVVDVNRDGLPDFVFEGESSDGYKTYTYINEGDKSMEAVEEEYLTYAPKSFLDLDNDGLPESVYGECVRKNMGDFRTYEDYPSLPVDPDVYRDFNNDGLTDYIKTENNEFVVYENKGAMSFSELRRYALPPNCKRLPDEYVVGDFDGDNKPDIAFTDYDSRYGVTTYSEKLYIIWNDGTYSEIAAPSGHQYGLINGVYDLSNNGCDDICVDLDKKNALIFMNRDHTWTIQTKSTFMGSMTFMRSDGHPGTRNLIVKTRKNTSPQPPVNLGYSIKEGYLTLNWEAGSDNETPQSALRYNVSVKYKGAEGDESYLISPLNGTVDFAGVPVGAQLVSGLRYPIPLIYVPEREIEVRVQTVDRFGVTSAFSEPLYFTATSSAAMSVPAETMAYSVTPVILRAGLSADDVNFGEDAVIEKIVKSTVYVYWTTPGMHTLTACGQEYEIMVHPLLSAYFELPANAQLNDKILVKCDNVHNGSWEYSDRHIASGRIWWPVNVDGGDVTLESVDDETVAISVIKRGMESTVAIRHTLAESYGSAVHEAEVKIADKHKYWIDYVDLDESTNRHRVNWILDYHDSDATGVNIYRESSVSGEYELLETVPLAETSYIDRGSNPDNYASKYVVALALGYGTSKQSYPQQPIHLTINKGLNGEVNLIWSKYYGRTIATYRILRGADKNHLALIDEVSGSVSSYTDSKPVDSESYYAVEVLIDAVSGSGVAPANHPASYASANRVSRSNIVCNNTGGITGVAGVSGESYIEIYSLDGNLIYNGLYRGLIGNTLEPGIYIMHTESTSRKIIVK